MNSETPKCGKARRSKFQKANRASEKLHKLNQENTKRVDSERIALRRIEINGGDEIELGIRSSGWSEYQEILRKKLLLLRNANIHQADEIASTFNKTGFKTGSGKKWTPRLVNISKIISLGILTDRLINKSRR